MSAMAFDDLVGHVIPIVLAAVALVLIVQALLDRGPRGVEGDGRRQGDDGDPTDGSLELTAELSDYDIPLAPPAAPMRAAGTELLYDFSADVTDIEDDPWEITMMSRVPDELRAKMEGKLADRSEARTSEVDVDEYFLVTGVARSDRGLKRDVNEDAFLVIDDEPLFLVADGMGGYAGGDVASKLAVEVIASAFQSRRFDGPVNPDWPLAGDELVRTFHKAHDAVRARKADEPRYMDMGTTAVAARFSRDKTKVFIANCGDSRCYRIREGAITQLTQDHTLATLLGIKGKAGKKLTQAIGVHDAIAVDLSVDEPMSGDVYLVCSDGLTKMVDDEAILQLTVSTEGLEAKARILVDESNARGGKDNITVIVIRVDEKPGAIVDSPRAAS
jgi:protein phosphatase